MTALTITLGIIIVSFLAAVLFGKFVRAGAGPEIVEPAHQGEKGKDPQ